MARSEARPLGGAFDPIEWAVTYGERRAERDHEERQNPALICERNGIHIRTWADPACVICGDDEGWDST